MTGGYSDEAPETVYLDAATAAPLHPVARQALLAALEDGWADPDRLYAQSRRSRQLLDAATAAMAEALDVREDEVAFCASGTEAAHRAIAGGLCRADRTAATFVHSAIEHSAVLQAAARHEAGGHGTAVTVPVDRLGRIDLDAFAAAVQAPGVALAALMSASHAVGTTQPVATAAGLCAEAGVPLYVDAAQSVGRVPVPAGWSILTASARKWGGPPNVGVLVVRGNARFEPAWAQADPVNVPSVVAAAASLRAVMAEAEEEAARLTALVAKVRSTLAATVPDIEFAGDPDDRLPHIVTFSCLYLGGEALLQALDRRGFAVGSGSACASPAQRPSHVLEAMGALTHGNVRLSLHRDIRETDIDRFLGVLPEVVRRLRAEAGVDDR
ncbi:MAG: aminotransferase class V-fold PLP-dependent enzyme [Dactylosporangium sp.]|nr:aminotransferase class V-fold PLP-dependent enzyme [Dactylosporangium sp.]NNJ61865.1 aminotransferase class V-fold PLP-dependent enzyme [Dactylosporangium sp.]